MSNTLGFFSEFDQLMHFLRAHVVTFRPSIFEWTATPLLYLALLFAPFLFWSVLLRTPMLTVTVSVLAWLGSVSFLMSAVAAWGGLQFIAAWAACLLMCATAMKVRGQRRALQERVRETEAKLAAISLDLDRERLWRRASGNDQTVLDNTTFRKLAGTDGEATAQGA